MNDLTPEAARRLYVAGPMTGLPDHNYPAFAEAAARLRAVGYEVESPANSSDQETLDFDGEPA